MEIRDHQLVPDGEAIQQKPSGNYSGTISPKFIVIHYTAGGEATATIDYMAQNGVSAHLVVARDAKIYQLVDFNRKAWHAGRSYWRGISGLNSHSIGIEICNYGWLLPQGDGSYKRPGETPTFTRDEVYVGDHRNGWPKECGWELFKDEQVNIVRDICRSLMSHYPTIREIVGHDEISPERKQDPGPAFPIESLRSKFDKRGEDRPRVYEVKAPSGLNMRSGRSVVHPVIRPLVYGTRVYVLQEVGEYVPVGLQDDGTIDGFVHQDWLRLA